MSSQDSNTLSAMASLVEAPSVSGTLQSSGLTSPSQSSGASVVRKCIGGKNKDLDCPQGMDHPNTRWECAYETVNKEEFSKHCKNISKRGKWRELVEAAKPDNSGAYHCVYYSTDRHHVENHYHKGSSDPMSPSPQAMRYKNAYMHPGRYYAAPPTGKKASKKWRDEDDDYENSGEDTREMKKMKQDASLLGFFQEQHAGLDQNGDGKDAVNLPDNMKVTELVETVGKKLELSQDVCNAAVEKFHKHGFYVVYGLKSLKKEGWEKLELQPATLEEELKSQVSVANRGFAAWGYMPFWGFPHQGGFWSGQYNAMGQPVYYPYPGMVEGSQDAVMTEATEKEKQEEHNAMESVHVALEAPHSNQGLTLPPIAKEEQKM